jgi:hypothetical protein
MFHVVTLNAGAVNGSGGVVRVVVLGEMVGCR